MISPARARGLRHMLEGTVRREAAKLHVSASLIDVASGARIGASVSNNPMSVVPRCRTRLPRAPRPVLAIAGRDHELHSYRPRAAEAYFLQLEARAHLKPFTRLPLMKALTLFEQALVLDPDYRWPMPVGVDLLLMASTACCGLRVDEAMPMARRAARRAIALDEEAGDGAALAA